MGRPRQEDFFIGDLLQELLSPLFPLVMPGVVDLWSYGETGYHSLAADGTILAVNETELAMVGYTRDEFVGPMPAPQWMPSGVAGTPLDREAWSGAAVRSGDTIWLRGGTYTGKQVSTVAGVSSSQVCQRPPAYPCFVKGWYLTSKRGVSAAS